MKATLFLFTLLTISFTGTAQEKSINAMRAFTGFFPFTTNYEDPKGIDTFTNTIIHYDTTAVFEIGEIEKIFTTRLESDRTWSILLKLDAHGADKLKEFSTNYKGTPIQHGETIIYERKIILAIKGEVKSVASVQTPILNGSFVINGFKSKAVAKEIIKKIKKTLQWKHRKVDF